MKKKTPLIIPALGLAIGAITSLITRQETPYFEANATSTEMDNVGVEPGEELDTNNVFYDDFSNGISMDNWVISKKAWGNSGVSRNSGVVPENVYYNSTDKTVLFRALGDYYKDNDFNYDLDDWYGYAHDDVTGGGRVYSRDGTRTGGCIKSRDVYGPGRFEARFKVAPMEGVCTAFWTFNYGESGGTNYNEMDFELPTYVEGEDQDDLYFNQIICTTYKNEDTYKSQRVAAPVYLNDNKFHTYCLEWYYSNNTKMVKWFVDEVLIGSWANPNQISNNVGRVTLGVWIPGRSSFCGIPNFDKSFMELDYFKYTPFKNQTNINVPEGLGTYEEYYRTVTTSPKTEFVPHGDFKYGLEDHFETSGDVNVSHSYDINESNGSYGIKISGENHTGNSYLRYINPNIRGIKKLVYSFNYRGYGSARAYADGVEILATGTLASRNEWTTFSQELSIPAGKKTIKIYCDSESNDFGFFVDNISLKYSEEEEEVIPNATGYSFFTKNNGQTSDNVNTERVIAPNNNVNQNWRFSSCKYYVKSDVNTIAMKPTNAIMTSTSGSPYYPIKQALASTYSDTDDLACAMMEFDIDNFKDIEVDLYSYSGTGGRTITLLYSLNEGASWGVFSSISCSALTSGSSPFRYYFRVSSGALTGETVRFVIIGNKGSNSDPYLLDSVIINNYQSFKDKLDTALCNADVDTRIYLAHQYSELTSEELNLLASEQMKHFTQSYASGYAYLLSYWGNGGNNAPSFINSSIKNDGTTLIISIIVVFTSALVAALFIYKKKLNQ